MIIGKLLKLIFLFTSLFLVSYTEAATDDQHIKIALRNIGHQFLLSIGDSTSRVLPIEKIDGRYAVQFERTFAFQPEKLIELCTSVLIGENPNGGYIVEVERCHSPLVVHSFEINSFATDSAIACAGRSLPEDCYVFYFTEVASKNSGRSDNAHISNENGLSENTSSGLLYLLLIIPFSLTVYWYLNRKNKNRIKLNPDLIQIGQLQYDQKRMILFSKSESIELSGKESELLLLLYQHENKILEREYILNQVWQDTGEYVGRTLDVFISKLRKKMETDPNLKIINIRGVGYKFVIN